MSLKDKVAIIGIGQTKFGENFGMSYHDMIIEACTKAFADAKIEQKEIQAAWLARICHSHGDTRVSRA